MLTDQWKTSSKEPMGDIGEYATCIHGVLISSSFKSCYYNWYPYLVWSNSLQCYKYYRLSKLTMKGWKVLPLPVIRVHSRHLKSNAQPCISEHSSNRGYFHLHTGILLLWFTTSLSLAPQSAGRNKSLSWEEYFAASLNAYCGDKGFTIYRQIID